MLLLVILLAVFAALFSGLAIGLVLGSRRAIEATATRLSLDSSLSVACPACGGKFAPWRKPTYEGSGWWGQERGCEECGRRQRRRYKGEKEGK